MEEENKKLSDKLNGLVACYDRIFLIRDEDDEKTASGIFLGTPKINYTGTVIAMGSGIKDIAMPDAVKIGVRIAFLKHSGVEFMYNRIKLISIRSQDILAIISDVADIEYRSVM